MTPPVAVQVSANLANAQARAVLDFVAPACLDRTIGGYATDFRGDGTLADPHARNLVQQARYTHAFALAAIHDWYPDAAAYAIHGLDWLRNHQQDPINGGWWWDLDGTTPVDRRKYTYGQAFALFAASTAVSAGLPAEDLIAAATSAIETHLWLPDANLAIDETSEDWRTIDPYRGQNANMHLCEASLAAFEATADPTHLDRAETVARRVTQDLAAQSGGLLWEHYHTDWSIDLDYHKDTPRDLFKPWGVLTGHQFEWAKLLVQLDRHRATEWALPTAIAWFDLAVIHSWDAERGGFVYAYDLAGHDVDRERYHWVIAEAIGAAAALYGATGHDVYRRWMETCWGYAIARHVDPNLGGWWPAVDANGRRVELPFAKGKPDVYHPLGACLATLQALAD